MINVFFTAGNQIYWSFELVSQLAHPDYNHLQFVVYGHARTVIEFFIYVKAVRFVLELQRPFCVFDAFLTAGKCAVGNKPNMRNGLN